MYLLIVHIYKTLVSAPDNERIAYIRLTHRPIKSQILDNFLIKKKKKKKKKANYLKPTDQKLAETVEDLTTERKQKTKNTGQDPNSNSFPHETHPILRDE